MAGILVNTYGVGHSDLENIMNTLTICFFGHSDYITITNFNNSSIPAIAAGSIIEVNGVLYTFNSEEVISLIDPHTLATVADGIVYIMLVPNGDSITACFTATAPTWNDVKQGWYGIATWLSDKYVGGCIKGSGNYISKFTYRGLEKVPKKYESNMVITSRSVGPYSCPEFTETITFVSTIDAVLSVIPSCRLGSAGTNGLVISDVSFTGNILTVKYKIKNGDNLDSDTAVVSLLTSIIGY